jgi:O-antigen ligase
VSRFADLPTRAFLFASLVLGGAGLSNPLANWLVVTLGLLVLAQRLPALTWSDFDRNAKRVVGLVLATGSLCLLQMVPLPREIWAAMPGHELAAQIAATAGGVMWTAWSLAPDRTFDAMMALVPVAAALLIAAQATRDERLTLLRAVLAVALAGAVLAVIQISAGPNSAPVLFKTTHRGFGIGFFVNRNHFALFLLVAMQVVALPGVPAVLQKVENPRAAEWGLRAASLILLALGVLSSLSRTGILLLPVALATAVLVGRQGRVRVPIVAGGFVLAALLAFIMRATPPVQLLLERFATTAEDKRFEYWANTLDAIRDALPLGTGFATFTLIYPTYEPLNEIYLEVVNHAHSDILELALEAGVPGLALLLAWLCFVAVACVGARKAASTRRERLIPLTVGLAVVLALAASLVDYPIRMHTVAVTLALLVGMLLNVCKAELPSGPSWSRRGLVWAPLMVLGAVTASAQWGQHLARGANELLAARVAPWSSLVQSAAATRFQLLGQVEASSGAARKALALAPMDAPALRAEGMAALALGRRDQGAALMSLGARLGWRDIFTQLWLAEQAMAAGAHGFAIQRIDAVLRQGKFDAELLPLLPGLMHTQGGRVALAEQLAFEPGWRVAFFNAVARDRTWTMPQLLDLIARLRRTEAPVNEVDTGLIRAVLASSGRYGDVRRVWLASGQRALIGDGSFDARPGAVSQWQGPYAWYGPPLTGVRLDVAEANLARKGYALAITSDGLAPGGALAQTLVLTPGPHRLAFSSRADDEALLRQLQVTLECRRNADTALGEPFGVALNWRPRKDGWQQADGRFFIPDGCPGQILTLLIPQAGGRPFSIWLDDVSIRSVTPPGA